MIGKKNKHWDSRYGVWSGEPNGTRPDFTKCAASVYPARSFIEHQCRRACGHGPDGAFCKQHAKQKEMK